MMNVSLRPWIVPPGWTLLTFCSASPRRMSCWSTSTSRGTTCTDCGVSRRGVSVRVAVAERVAR
jgi:hypothetical protein